MAVLTSLLFSPVPGKQESNSPANTSSPRSVPASRKRGSAAAVEKGKRSVTSSSNKKCHDHDHGHGHEATSHASAAATEWHHHNHHHHEASRSPQPVNRVLFEEDSDEEGDDADCQEGTICEDMSCPEARAAIRDCCDHSLEEHEQIAGKCHTYVQNNLVRRHSYACHSKCSGTDLVGRKKAPPAPKAGKIVRKTTTRQRAFQIFAKEEHARLAKTGLAYATRVQLISRAWKVLAEGERSEWERYAEGERERMAVDQQEQEFKYLTYGFSSRVSDPSRNARMEAFARELASRGRE